MIAAPNLTSMPNIAFNPSPAPAIFPILNARPPNPINIDITVPNPLTTSLATSCPRNPVTTKMRHILIWAPISMMIESKMANAKLARNCCVKTAVYVKNAGPIAEVAIKKTDPNNKRLCVLVNSN